MALKKRIKIENATAFKLEYFEGEAELKEKEFSSYKSMEQFHSRQSDFLYLDINRWAFVNEKWHKFIKLRSPFVFQKEIDFLNKVFDENFEVKKLQNSNNEDPNPQK